MAWYNSCRIGVPYNLLRRSNMAGGLSFPSPLFAMTVFVVPPEWYAGLVDILNNFLRAVCMLR